MDLTNTIQPDSDQLDAVDLSTGPREFTIARVRQGNAEQPVQIDLAEFPRPWRPGKSMRRVLVSLWGADGEQYVGRRVRLYCDERVQFGGMAVGGTRIAAMSHIGRKKRAVPLLVSRGKSAMFTVEPLPDTPVGTSEAAAEATRPAEPPSNPGAPSRDQMADLVAAFRESNVSDVAAERLTWVNSHLSDGRDVTSPSQLTAEEVAYLTETLRKSTDYARSILDDAQAEVAATAEAGEQ